MGCDIHMWAEVKMRWNDGETEWLMVGHEFEYPYHREDAPNYVRTYGKRGQNDYESYESNKRLTRSPYSGRNYDLFAILADVRNGRGFAGIDTGDRFNPIAEPRGVPTDATDAYKEEVEHWGIDGHSHSWFTLAELKAYDWDQTTNHRGTVDAKEFVQWRHNGKPESWCGDVTGYNVRNVSNEDMEAVIRAGVPTEHVYTRVSWEEPYRNSVGTFLTDTIPALERIAAMDRVEDLRIVFFFDN